MYRIARSVTVHGNLNFDISRSMFSATGNVGHQTRGTNVNWCPRIRTRHETYVGVEVTFHAVLTSVLVGHARYGVTG